MLALPFMATVGYLGLSLAMGRYFFLFVSSLQE
jgi:hypothetical protein